MALVSPSQLFAMRTSNIKLVCLLVKGESNIAEHQKYSRHDSTRVERRRRGSECTSCLRFVARHAVTT
jgi:hypothetical protein